MLRRVERPAHVEERETDHLPLAVVVHGVTLRRLQPVDCLARLADVRLQDVGASVVAMVVELDAGDRDAHELRCAQTKSDLQSTDMDGDAHRLGSDIVSSHARLARSVAAWVGLASTSRSDVGFLTAMRGGAQRHRRQGVLSGG
jgi:hypothetical protein